MRYAIFVLCVALAPVFVSAHTTGISYEATTTDHVVDVGYDPASLVAGERVVLDFNLKQLDSTNADFDYVWVRLVRGSEPLLATGVMKADIGPTTLLYELPPDMSGDLAVSVRYQKGDASLAETSFTIPINPAPRSWKDLWIPLSAAAGGMLAGALLVVFYRRRSMV